MKRIIFILTFFVCSFPMLAQDLDQYKYVIVPEEFEFSKEKNQFQLNALTKFLFEKYGFETLMKNEEKPADLQENYCLGLNAKVKDNSGLFVTKLVVQLEDCRGNIVYETQEGRSREKDYKTAHHEALRNAFSDIEELNYSFNPGEVSAAAPSSDKQPQAAEKAEVAQSEPETRAPEATEDVETPATAPTEQAEPAEVVVENPMIDNESAKELEFEKDGTSYFLEKSDSGYSFFQENSEEPFAVLAKSGGENSFLYKSLTRQGVAYFGEDGNLVVEYLNEENKSVKLVYKASASQ
ncbi:hypothetical protein APR41_09125 [Salegentibacter salinarum]|uniref:Uncharacterized protein n=1 Tax=Salegentibacter salinarum TaxID=447422 RepID=A0A2N0TP34_9FLAO|nr:hypothetical protein [Salegentibacter salinarum]PKD16493.1 hypothetical protein APR41_09125 [Salegentibacter salinarum]SKB64907.1 hypothetical protein SAMN05660903_01859 [Salegentibacter salinarum]